MKNTKRGKTKTRKVGKSATPVPGALLDTIEQTAVLLGLGKVSVYRLIREQKLESVVLLDRTRRVTRASTERLIAESKESFSDASPQPRHEGRFVAVPHEDEAASSKVMAPGA
jgi:hypothetical protein